MISKKITLEEIAKKINISRTTLYKVINNTGRVNDSTRKKVIEALKFYNYAPNLNARNLAHNKSYVIAYIGMEDYSKYFAEMTKRGLNRAIEEFSDNGFHIVSAVSEYSIPNRQIQDIDEMLKNGIRSFIITPSNPKILVDKIKELRKKNCDIIYLSRQVKEKTKAYVGIDYYRSGMLAAEMMTKIMPYGGNIAVIINGKLENDDDVKQRYLGFVDFIRNNGKSKIEYQREDVNTIEEAVECCDYILSDNMNINAIYDISYKLHIIAQKLIHLKKDQEIKLIGFDLYDENIQYIKSSAIDIVIGQSLVSQTYQAAKMMFYKCCYGDKIDQTNYYSRLDVVVSSNVDYFVY